MSFSTLQLASKHTLRAVVINLHARHVSQARQEESAPESVRPVSAVGVLQSAKVGINRSEASRVSTSRKMQDGGEGEGGGEK